MKVFFLLIFLSVEINLIEAANVDSIQARKIATNFYQENSPIQTLSLALAYTEMASLGDTALYYIFNVNQNDGWVIVSADDAALPIIAYSTSGHYYPSSQSPELLYFMKSYGQELLSIKETNLQSTIGIQAEWCKHQTYHNQSASRGSSGVSPLLKTNWSQNQFYNDSCPADGKANTGNYKCYTGCVATSMAQIMKYWNYPPKGTGSNSYNDEISYGFTYNEGEQKANFGTTIYDWASMPVNSLTSSNSAVATLMHHCGVSVNMDYGPYESSANIMYYDSFGAASGGLNYHPICSEYAYTTYFGYNSSTIQGLQRGGYSDTYWIKNILEPELNNGRPFQYGGFDPPNSGHSWVCDGYDANDYFHMNWGWNGEDNNNSATSDGYWNLNKLNPATYNFYRFQEALIGIQPNSNCTDEFEPNDNTSEATLVFASPLNSGNSDYTLQANIGWDGDQDWYKINIANPGTLTIKLSNLPYNYDLELYGPNGLSDGINSSYNTGTTPEQIVYTYSGTSTTVYAKVYPSVSNPSQYTTSSCYNLEFIWTATTNASLPDLYLSSTTLSSNSVQPGESINVSEIITNGGSGNANTSLVGYYFSDNCFIDGSSIFLGSNSVSALSSGGTNSLNNSIIIPTTATMGTYYILFIADYLGTVTESNENNNLTCLPITINSNPVYLPNLYFTAPCSVGTNDSITYTFKYSVGNNGNAYAGTFYINCYVCTSPNFSNPIWVGADYAPEGIPVNGNFASQITLNLCNEGVAQGYYYFGVYINYFQQIVESSMSDNNQIFSNQLLPVRCAPVCQYSIAPNNINFLFGGGSGLIYLTCNNSCPWTAGSSDSWITVQNLSGQGNNYINYQVSTNQYSTPRTGTISIMGQVYTIYQDGQSCPVTISPISDTVSNVDRDHSFNFTTGLGCGYSAGTSDPSWLTIVSVVDSVVMYHVTANNGISRSGIITMDTTQHFVYQNGTVVICSNPPNGLSVNDITENVASATWIADVNAVSYNISYEEVGGLWSSEIQIDNNTFPLAGLNCNTEYEFRVSENCAGGVVSNYSEYYFYTANCCASANPQIVYPDTNSVIYGNDITFQWSEVPNAQSYYFIISRDEYLDSIEFHAQDQDYYYTNNNVVNIDVNTFNQDGTEYYWGVMALGNSCNSEFVYSSFFSGDCYNSAAPTPLLYFPPNASIQYGDTIYFNWSNTSCATNYEFQLSTSSGFDYQDITDDYVSPNFSIESWDFPTAGDVFYWRVREENGFGWGDWSNYWTNPSFFITGGISSVTDIDDKNKLSIFPNPNRGRFTILLSNAQDGSYTININEVSGKQLFAKSEISKNNEIREEVDLSEMASGFYIVQLISGEKVVTAKFCKF